MVKVVEIFGLGFFSKRVKMEFFIEFKKEDVFGEGLVKEMKVMGFKFKFFF